MVLQKKQIPLQIIRNLSIIYTINPQCAKKRKPQNFVQFLMLPRNWKLSYHLTIFFILVPGFFRSYKKFYDDFKLEKQVLQLMSNRPFCGFQSISNNLDLVRFLWYEDICKKNPELVILRFCRVVFGLTCSPFLLNGTISFHLQRLNNYVNLKEFICKCIRDSYIDDSRLNS